MRLALPFLPKYQIQRLGRRRFTPKSYRRLLPRQTWRECDNRASLSRGGRGPQHHHCRSSTSSNPLSPNPTVRSAALEKYEPLDLADQIGARCCQRPAHAAISGTGRIRPI